MDAIIISIGTELTTGQCLDTNASWLAEQLSDHGARILRHVTVTDNVDHIATCFREAMKEADMVIATGGLGPTPDDLTREALAIALDKPLETDQAALRQLEAFFARLERSMPPANVCQAMRPQGCEILPNPRGTAPGISHSSSSGHFFILPGVPSEMRAMFQQSIEPLIAQLATGARTARSRLLVFGISEAKLGELLSDLMNPGRSPSVGTSAADGVISVRIVARGESESDARRLLAADVDEVRSRLGDSVFGEGEDTLADAVGSMLLEQGLTVATAESCTGGLIAKHLTDVPGSSGYFIEGFVLYHNSAKTDRLGIPREIINQKGAVSEPVARAMAESCRGISGCDFSISTTGIAGPDGGHPPDKPVGLVYVGLAWEAQTEVRRLLLGDHLTRDEVRDRACKTALNMLRLRLIESQGRP